MPAKRMAKAKGSPLPGSSDSTKPPCQEAESATPVEGALVWSVPAWPCHLDAHFQNPPPCPIQLQALFLFPSQMSYCSWSLAGPFSPLSL